MNFHIPSGVRARPIRIEIKPLSSILLHFFLPSPHRGRGAGGGLLKMPLVLSKWVSSAVLKLLRPLEPDMREKACVFWLDLSVFGLYRTGNRATKMNSDIRSFSTAQAGGEGAASADLPRQCSAARLGSPHRGRGPGVRG